MKNEQDLNKLTLYELEEKLKDIKAKKESALTKKVDVWEVGSNYVIRTVTMIQVGRLIEVTDKELVMETCAWVADTGRWTNFLKDGIVKEVEPFQDNVIIGRASIIDATKWKHELLTKQV